MAGALCDEVEARAGAPLGEVGRALCQQALRADIPIADGAAQADVVREVPSSDVARRLSEVLWALMGARFLATQMSLAAVAAWLRASGLPQEPLDLELVVLVDSLDVDAREIVIDHGLAPGPGV